MNDRRRSATCPGAGLRSPLPFFSPYQSHGISAASGKIGSIIAQGAIAPLRTKGAKPGASGAAANPWLDNVMKIYAFFMLLGCFFTLLIPETKRFTLEQMSAEEADPASGITQEHHTVESKSNGPDDNEKIVAS